MDRTVFMSPRRLRPRSLTDTGDPQPPPSRPHARYRSRAINVPALFPFNSEPGRRVMEGMAEFIAPLAALER